MKRNWFIGMLLAVVTAVAAAPAPAASVYDLVADESRLEIGVFRGGLLKIFGHNHRIAAGDFSGEVHFDPDRPEAASLVLTVAAGSLRVLDSGESAADRREIEATMLGDRVLGVEAYPQIVFRSRGVDAIRPTATGWELLLTGTLALHGVERALAFPVRLVVDDARLTGEGEVPLAQSAFGIRPVVAAGGLVRVRDEVRVTFSLVAQRRRD